MRHIIYIFLIFSGLCSCQEENNSKDLTVPGSFTSGAEGPATDKDGNIYAVNFKEEGTIGKITQKGEASLFLKLPDSSIGNGIRFNTSGEMFVADYVGHNVLKIDPKTKEISVYAHEHNANQPNDLAIHSDGTLFASDPSWANETGNIWKITKQNGFELLESDMGTTNGIEVSTDETKLYVNESVQRNIWVYDLTADKKVTNKKLFHKFEDYGMDGMRCDNKGNLYICRYGKGTIAVLSKDGELLKEFQLQGKKPSNITFSNDYKQLYVTIQDRGCIETLRNELE